MGVGDDSLRVLMLIGRMGPISRNRIGRTLGFSPSRVTRLCDSLLRGHLIHETGHEKSTGGRRSALLELKEHGYLLGGVLVSFSSEVQAILMDLRANVLHEATFRVSSRATPEELVGQVDATFAEILDRGEGLRERLVGVGMGVSGLVDPSAGVVHSCPGLPTWRETPLAQLVRDRLGVPTFLENEATMSTLAELWFGQGRGRSNFLYVSLGPGVRMGIVIDGTIYRGATGNAGELGHITYDPDGPICHCGNTGCLETLVSSEALLAEARAALTPHSTSLLVERCGGDPEALEAGHIHEAARLGDRLALTLLSRLCRPIGLSLASVVNIFDCETIIIGGTLADAGQLVLDYLREEIHRHALPVMSRNVTLKLATFGVQSTAIGGGGLVLQKICDGEVEV